MPKSQVSADRSAKRLSVHLFQHNDMFPLSFCSLTALSKLYTTHGIPINQAYSWCLMHLHIQNEVQRKQLSPREHEYKLPSKGRDVYNGKGHHMSIWQRGTGGRSTVPCVFSRGHDSCRVVMPSSGPHSCQKKRVLKTHQKSQPATYIFPCS